MTLRQNASIHATEAQAKRFETLLKDDPDVDHFSTYVGRGAIRFILTFDVQLANPFFAQFVIVTKGLEARERVQQKLEQALADQFPDVVARVSPLELGPPVGWPLQYRITGPDKDEVRRHRAPVRRGARLRRARRGTSTSTGWSRRGRCACTSTRTRRAGSASARARWRPCSTPSVTGSTVTQLRDDIYLVNVVARATDDQRASFATLELAAGAHAERAHGAAAAIRDVRGRAGVPAGLAARPRADADGARGRDARRAAGFRRRRARAEGRRVRREAAEALSRSPPAACTRRAPRRALRCSRSCR